MTPPPQTPAHSPSVIQVEGLVAHHGEREILHDVSFDVAEGETLVVLGPSGCGKSTLLRCLMGLHRPTRGSIRMFDQDIYRISEAELDALRRRIGVSFQSAALLGSLTVGENVALPLQEHTHLPAPTVRIMTRLKLDQVGLSGFEDYMPSELSGGMRKRAGIARALAMDPRCLFLDEPSAGLDPITAAGLDQLLQRLRRALGLTMIVVTHELASAYALARRLMLPDQGGVRILDTVDAVRSSEDEVVRRFLDRRPADEDDGGDLLRELVR